MLSNKSDRIFGLGVVAVALAYLVSATQIPAGFLSDPVGSRTFPYIIGSIALLCGILIILRPDEDPSWPAWPTVARIGSALAVMYVFAVILRPLGFIPSAFVASTVISYLIVPRLLQALLTGAGLAVGLFFILKYGLGLGIFAFGKMLAF